MEVLRDDKTWYTQDGVISKPFCYIPKPKNLDLKKAYKELRAFNRKLDVYNFERDLRDKKRRLRNAISEKIHEKTDVYKRKRCQVLAISRKKRYDFDFKMEYKFITSFAKMVEKIVDEYHLDDLYKEIQREVNRIEFIEKIKAITTKILLSEVL